MSSGTKQRTLGPDFGTYQVTTLSRGRKVTREYGHVLRSGHEKMVGVEHPNWLKRINSGTILNDSCHYTLTKREQLPGTCTWAGSSWTSTLQGSVEAHFGVGQEWSDHEVFDPGKVVALAKLKALSSLDSTPHEMIEDVLELRSTIEFLGNPLESIKDLSLAFQRHRQTLQKRGLSRSAALANAWLQYRFALLPLLGTASAIYNSLFTDYKPSKRQRRSKSSSDGETFDREYVNRLNTWAQSIHLNVSSRAVIHYLVDNPVGGWRGQLGLRLKDVPKGLWAVLPLSFMVDRIIDISSAISSVVNLSDPELHILFASVSTKHKRVFVSKLVRYDRYESFSSNSGGEHVTTFSYTRLPWAPSYFDAVPPVDLTGLVSSTTRIIDLVTLIVQRLS